MRFGLIGLGRMGRALGAHAVEQGHVVIGYDRDPAARMGAAAAGIEVADSIPDLAARLSPSRLILLYVPHGAPTEEVCQLLPDVLAPGDLVADAGNSHWDDSRRRYVRFRAAGIHFLDIGTSGGIEGARHGAAFMVGGEPDAFEIIRPLLRTLAVDDDAVFFAGPSGAGHFVKMVHNAVEFGMIQAVAEGVELLEDSGYVADPAALFATWNHGSVIRSWLVELMAKALREAPDRASLSTFVEDTGEVKWVLTWGLQRDIPTPVVSAAQTALMMYRDRSSPAAKAVALLRHQFGGHPVHHDGEASGNGAGR